MPRIRQPRGTVLTEPHSAESLEWLINEHKSNPTNAGETWRTSSDMTRILEALLRLCSRARDGVVAVRYTQMIYGGSAVGRRYDDGAGLQMLWTPYRAALVRDMMRRLNRVIVDLDMNKCHPTLFPQICDQLNVDASHAFLDGFVRDPETFFRLAERDAGANPGQAKQLVCSLLNLGGVDGWQHNNNLTCSADSELYFVAKAASSEILAAIKGCAREDPRLWDVAKASVLDDGEEPSEFNILKRFQHLLLSRAENHCLQAAEERLLQLGNTIVALIFDGVAVQLALPASTPEAQVEAAAARLCRDLERAVRAKTQFQVKFARKPWDTSITIPEDPANEPELDDVSATEIFIAWLHSNGYRLVRCGGTYLYDPSVGIYTNVDKDSAGSPELRGLMSKCGGMQRWGRYVSKKKLVEIELLSQCPVDNLFLVKAERAAKGRLAWNNGVYDFATKRLLPFSPDIPMFNKLNHDYPTTDEDLRDVERLVQEIERRVVEPIWGDDAGFVLPLFARGMAGCVEDKRVAFGVGDGNAGKGVWIDACKSGFSGYIGNINSGNLVCSQRSEEGDKAKANSWMLKVADKRLVFASEIKTGGGLGKRRVKIDGTVIKMLSTGGEPQTGRLNHQDECDFVMQGLVVVFANDVPDIAGVKSCEATRRRLVFLNMKNRFLTGEEYERNKDRENVRKGDDKIKSWLKQADVGRAFAYMICKSYVDERPDMTVAVAEYTDEWCKGTNPTSGNLMTDVLELAPADCSVTVAEVEAALEAKEVIMSGNKIGREIKKAFNITSVLLRQGNTVKKVYYGLCFRPVDREVVVAPRGEPPMHGGARAEPMCQ